MAEARENGGDDLLIDHIVLGHENLERRTFELVRRWQEARPLLNARLAELAGNREPKRAADPRRRLQIDRATHELDEVLRYCEPETSASEAPRYRAIRLTERLEQPRAQVRSDANSRVFDNDANFGAIILDQPV